jgi:hypothetical protein
VRKVNGATNLRGAGRPAGAYARAGVCRAAQDLAHDAGEFVGKLDQFRALAGGEALPAMLDDGRFGQRGVAPDDRRRDRFAQENRGQSEV